jgi:predicted DNA-binding ribbon-helix-helix protein
MLVIRNIVVRGKRTSVRLEPEMWEALREVVALQGLSVNQLATQLDRRRSGSSLTSAIRVYVVEFYRSAAHDALRDEQQSTARARVKRKRALSR